MHTMNTTFPDSN